MVEYAGEFAEFLSRSGAQVFRRFIAPGEGRGEFQDAFHAFRKISGMVEEICEENKVSEQGEENEVADQNPFSLRGGCADKFGWNGADEPQFLRRNGVDSERGGGKFPGFSVSGDHGVHIEPPCAGAGNETRSEEMHPCFEFGKSLAVFIGFTFEHPFSMQQSEHARFSGREHGFQQTCKIYFADGVNGGSLGGVGD